MVVLCLKILTRFLQFYSFSFDCLKRELNFWYFYFLFVLLLVLLEGVYWGVNILLMVRLEYLVCDEK